MSIKIDPVELRRKTLHIVLGIAIAVLVSYRIIGAFELFVILAVGIVLSFLCVKYKIPIIYPLLDKFERKHVHPGKGAITFMIGIILSIKLFPMDIALASIMILAIGDGIATLIGPLGKTHSFLSQNKLFEGTIAGMACAAVGAWMYVPFHEALLASVIAMGIEATEIKLNNKILSDNVLVPLVAGTTLILFRHYL